MPSTIPILRARRERRLAKKRTSDSRTRNAFLSAGMILCGQNILTSSDMNAVATNHFDGLKASPYNFHAHYRDDASQDDWLSEYRSFHDNPVIMLSDGAYVKVDGKKTTLVRGDAWVLRKDSEKEKLEAGGSIVP